MKIAKEVRQGEVIPEWYGVAWIRWGNDSTICYPMPFYLIVAAVRATVIWMRHGYRAAPYNSRDAYAQGMRDGKRAQSALERKVIRQILEDEIQLHIKASEQNGYHKQYQQALHLATIAQGISCALSILERKCGV